MYSYTPLCRYWITLYRYVLVFIVPQVDIELEDNKQFISNIPRRDSEWQKSFSSNIQYGPLSGQLENLQTISASEW